MWFSLMLLWIAIHTQRKRNMFWYVSRSTWSEVTNFFLCFYRSIVFQLYIYVCDQFSITLFIVWGMEQSWRGSSICFVYGYLIFPVLFVESKDYPFTTKLSLPLVSLHLCSKSVVLIYVEFIAGLFILFHDSICLFWYQYHTILIAL